MENIAVHSRGFKEMRCSCGYFRSDGKKKLYRLPNQFDICEVHEPLAMFFKKNAPQRKRGAAVYICQQAQARHYKPRKDLMTRALMGNSVHCA